MRKLNAMLTHLIAHLIAIVTPTGDALPPILLSVKTSQCQSHDTLDSLIARANSVMCN